MNPSNPFRIATRLWLGLALAFFSPGVLAKAPHTFEGEVQSQVHECQRLSEKASPLVEKICISQVKIKYKLSLLMGDPVARYHVYWEIDPTIYLRSGVTVGRRSDGFTVWPNALDVTAQTPAVQKAFAALVPIDPTRFVIEGNAWEVGSNSPVYFIFNGGDMARSGQGFGYNTPDGPSWDEFILDGDYYEHYKASQPLPYVPEAQAKDYYLHLDGQFGFSHILDLTFIGVAGLNSALRGELVYPLTVNVEGAEGSQITLLNSASPYQPGMQLKAGRYRIRVTHPGFKTVEKWIWLNAKHTSFSIRLKPEAKKKKKPAEKDQADNAQTDNAETASADDLDAMLEQTEKPSAKNGGDDTVAEDAPTDSLSDALDEVGREDAAERRQAEAQQQIERQLPLKQAYEEAVERCNASRPVLGTEPCTGLVLHQDIYCSMDGGRDKYEACERKNKADHIAYQRRCAREQAEWMRERDRFPQRLEAWKGENRQCLVKARADYDAAMRQFKEDQRDIDTLGNDIN